MRGRCPDSSYDRGGAGPGQDGAGESALLFPVLLIGCLALDALTSYGAEEVLLRRRESEKLTKHQLTRRNAHLEEKDWAIRRAYALTKDSLEGLCKLDLQVELDLSLDDVER